MDQVKVVSWLGCGRGLWETGGNGKEDIRRRRHEDAEPAEHGEKFVGC